jgi:DNA-binding transcriptional ArsR family regulator
MVEHSMRLDAIFSSLADATRRDMIRRVARKEHSIGELAVHYKLTFAAISKHLKVLEKAKLVMKKRRGREQIVSVSPVGLSEADRYLEQYRKLWEERFDRLEDFIKDK